MPQSLLREEYVSRINRVLDYIERNLDSSLNLRILAEVANFSPYHFHRIFGSITGEPLSRFISRVRLEKAALSLCDNSRKTITEIALDTGFSGSAAFSRSFRDFFGVSPSEWRARINAGDSVKESKICKKKSNMWQKDGKIRKDFDGYFEYLRNVNFTIVQPNKWRLEMQNEMRNKSNLKADVEVKDLPAMTVAYVRHIGPYAGDEKLFQTLFEKLFRWAGPRNLLGPDTKAVTVYHDNPDLTDEDKLRISVCVTVSPDTQVDGEIGKMDIPSGRYALAKFELTPDQYGDAWQAVYGGWLPRSGYQPDDRHCFEIYHNNPQEHPEGKHIVSICVPVKPM